MSIPLEELTTCVAIAATHEDADILHSSLLYELNQRADTAKEAAIFVGSVDLDIFRYIAE